MSNASELKPMSISARSNIGQSLWSSSLKNDEYSPVSESWMATTVSSCSFTSMCPRTKESEMDSMSKVIARITSGSRAKTLRKIRNRKDDLLTGRENLQSHGFIFNFVRPVGGEEGNAALHRIFYLVAERSVGQVDEDAAVLRAERVGEGLCGGDVAWRGRAEVELRRPRAGF